MNIVAYVRSVLARPGYLLHVLITYVGCLPFCVYSAICSGVCLTCLFFLGIGGADGRCGSRSRTRLISLLNDCRALRTMGPPTSLCALKLMLPILIGYDTVLLEFVVFSTC